MTNEFYDIQHPRDATLARAAERLGYDPLKVKAYVHAIQNNSYIAWLAATSQSDNPRLHKSEEVARSRSARIRKIPISFLPGALTSLHTLKVHHSER